MVVRTDDLSSEMSPWDLDAEFPPASPSDWALASDIASNIPFSSDLDTTIPIPTLGDPGQTNTQLRQRSRYKPTDSTQQVITAVSKANKNKGKKRQPHGKQPHASCCTLFSPARGRDIRTSSSEDTHSTAANSRSNVPNSSNQYSVLQDIDSDSSDHDHTDPDFREA